MKRFSAALLALGLGTSTLFTQLPVRATEKTADTAADTAVQTADPSIVTTNGIQGWPQASDISSTAAIVMETSPIQFSIPRTQTKPYILPVQ